MNPQAVDGQWLDFYALLEVPVNADEDTIRKRIGKVYSEAAANSDHRDPAKREYFRSLVERVLPQCRRVLLDPEWRAKYDRQHILHSIEDPSAQDYVSFIGSVRGGVPSPEDANLPSRVQEEIRIAASVVQTVQHGESLELLPSKSITSKTEPVPEPPAPEVKAPTHPEVTDQRGQRHRRTMVDPRDLAPNNAPFVEVRRSNGTGQDTIDAAALAQELETSGRTAPQEVHATVISAEEARDIRRRRTSNPDADRPIMPASMRKREAITGVRPGKRQGPGTRVVVGDGGKTNGKRERLISSTSLNLMVAITGVLLTISIQYLAVQPAVATNTSRSAFYVAYSPSLQQVMTDVEAGWERSPQGSGFDVVLQPEDARTGLNRALGVDSATGQPDVWIPSDSVWTQGYNRLAQRHGRQAISMESSVAQTPIVLVARSDRSAPLKQKFPDRIIRSWSTLRSMVVSAAPNHFGLTDPRRSGAGAIVRYSMAREWAQANKVNLRQATKSPALWKWMAAFEDNTPGSASRSDEMVKDLALGTTGRYWWALAYESEALRWMSQGKQVEIFYLPRTDYANHPICYMNRVGASPETNAARLDFEKYVRSEKVQQALLRNGFRPTEISLDTKVAGNPFTDPANRKRGLRTSNLPSSERIDYLAVSGLTDKWAELYS